jgi:hypothetical protein
MSVDAVYKLMLYIISKNAQSGYYSPTDFNRTINQASISYVNYLIGQVQQYQYGRPEPRVGLGMNDVVRQSLTAFAHKRTLSITSGVADYPSDYQIVDSMLTTGNKPIRYAQQNYLAAYLNSVIDPVSTNPIFLMENEGFRFYPSTLTSAILTYIGTPNEIVYAYELDSSGRQKYTTGIQGLNVITGGSGYTSATITFAPPVSGIRATATVTLQGGKVVAIVMTNYGSGYNNTTPTFTFTGNGTGAAFGTPITSQDPLWYELDLLEVIGRALRMIGVSLESGALQNYSQELKQTGQ